MSKLSLFGEGKNIVGKDGQKINASSLKGKILGLYFSAHWCPPCRGFTPALANKYGDILEAGNKFEIIFVSSDRDEASSAEYYKDMPWKMLEYSERDIKAALTKEFNIKGIPSLVLLNSKGELITTNGRVALMQVPFAELEDGKSVDAVVNKPKEVSRKQAAGVSADYSALLLSSIVAAFVGNHLGDHFGERAAEKSYRTFEEFYPFYMSQHSDQMCRRLHVVGTTVIVLMFIMDHRHFVALFPALLAGIGTCMCTGHLTHGLWEMLLMVSVLAGAGKITFGSFTKARGLALMMLIGYGFAWVGHFVYEQNRPATFIYPAFSLMGDFRLWYETVTGARPF